MKERSNSTNNDDVDDDGDVDHDAKVMVFIIIAVAAPHVKRLFVLAWVETCAQKIIRMRSQ